MRRVRRAMPSGAHERGEAANRFEAATEHAQRDSSDDHLEGAWRGGKRDSVGLDDLAVDVVGSAGGGLELDAPPRNERTPACDSSSPRRSPYARTTSADLRVASTTTASNAPSDGSASTRDPAPNAPVQATVTCHAGPVKATVPSQCNVHSTGLAVSPARSAPRAYATAPSGRFHFRAFRAATGGRPTLATFTNGRSSIRPSSSARVLVPRNASLHAVERSSGSPRTRAKSFAVPAGITARGTPEAAAAAAAHPTD